MGRGVEVAMLAAASDLVNGDLFVLAREAPKNLPALEFFTAFGAVPNSLSGLKAPEWPTHVHSGQNRPSGLVG
jgi:hypothetical protein